MAIDIGAAAIERPGGQGGNYTRICLENPANATGVITSLEFYAEGAFTGCKVGTFYGSGTDYTCRDYATLGAIAAGSKQTITQDSGGSPLSIDVHEGDFIGFIRITAGRIENSATGFAGLYWKAGDQFDAGQQTYTLAAGDAFSIYGIGVETQTISPSSIASAEAFGTPKLNLKLTASAIASQETFGALTVVPGAVSVLPTAIGSLEAFGSAKLNLKLILTGISSSEAFGTPIVTGGLTIYPSAIPSAEAFGAPVIAGPLLPFGIVSGEQFGSPIVNSGGLSVAPTGVPSTEQFGIPIIIVILAGGDGMSLPTAPGQAPIPSGQVSIPSKEVSI